MLRLHNADKPLFSFEDVLCDGTNGLVLGPDAVSLCFEERTLDNKPERKPNKAMLAKMGKLANHLKDVAMAFMRALRNGSEDSYAQVAADMKTIAMPSLVKFFNSDKAPCKNSKSVLQEYLLGSKYDKKSYAMPARFWFKFAHGWTISKRHHQFVPAISRAISKRRQVWMRTGYSWKYSNFCRPIRGDVA